MRAGDTNMSAFFKFFAAESMSCTDCEVESYK